MLVLGLGLGTGSQVLVNIIDEDILLVLTSSLLSWLCYFSADFSRIAMIPHQSVLSHWLLRKSQKRQARRLLANQIETRLIKRKTQT